MPNNLRNEFLQLGLKGILIAILFAVVGIGLVRFIYPHVPVIEYASIVVIIAVLSTIILIGIFKKQTNAKNPDED